MNKVVFALQYVHDHKHYKVIIISLESSWVEYVFVEGIAPCKKIPVDFLLGLNKVK